MGVNVVAEWENGTYREPLQDLEHSLKLARHIAFDELSKVWFLFDIYTKGRIVYDLSLEA